MVRVAKHWNRLLIEFAESPSLGIFKTQVDMILSNLI